MNIEMIVAISLVLNVAILVVLYSLLSIMQKLFAELAEHLDD